MDKDFPDCKGCGKCCIVDRVIVTPEERERLLDYTEHVHDNIYAMKSKDYDGMSKCCILLNTDDMSCSGYDIRPSICKKYTYMGLGCQYTLKMISDEEFIEKTNFKFFDDALTLLKDACDGDYYIIKNNNHYHVSCNNIHKDYYKKVIITNGKINII